MPAQFPRPVMNTPQHALMARPAPRLLSLVIPAYNEGPVLPLLRRVLERLVVTMACELELIFVDDGSTDETARLLMEWASQDKRVKVISLARNFGHQAAATAGLDHARGQAVVLMDADLQDPPELVHEMLQKYCEGYDVVYAQRVAREGEGILKRVTAWLFYRLMRRFVYRDLPLDTGDYRLISERCLRALQSMRETHRFLRGMVAWAGFPQTAVQFRRQRRPAGGTKYPVRKMVRFAWTAAVSFSPLPLKVSLALGILLALAGFSYGCYATVRVFLGLYVVPGWTSLLVVTCLIGGSILMGLGILGEYVARIYEEVKGRPLYLVYRSANLEPEGGNPVHPHAR